MVNVIPFKAFRYNETVVGDLSKVVAPPYDVMKGAKLDMVQGLSPCNIAWITKNKPQDNDTADRNPYTRARDLLHEFISRQFLIQDNRDMFYVYGQNFNVHGQNYFRYGFIGLMELQDFATGSPTEGSEPFSGVLQHEETLPKDIEDRLNLTRLTLTQFGQIFVIYPDREEKVERLLLNAMDNPPIMDIVDFEDIRHRLWSISNVHEINSIMEIMKNNYVIIADGHHRYKTALALNRERPDLPGSGYQMVTFVNMMNSGLVILPTHRLVQNLDDFNGEKLLDDLKTHFTIFSFDTKEDMFKEMDMAFEKGDHSLGLFMDDGNYYSLILKDIQIMEQALPEKSAVSQQLDVSILHALVLDRILGIDKEKLKQGTMKGGGYVVYIKGIGDAVEEAIQSVKEEAQAVFFMNPTRISEVEAVATNFECMPQKSTFFHPKVWTGFTINRIE